MSKNKNQDLEQVKNTPRFHVLDAVIILLVILAVVGVYFRYNILDYLTGEHNMKDFTVSFSIEDIRYTTPNYVHVNEVVYFSDDGDQMGKLLEVSEDMSNIALSVTPASKVFVDSDGTIKKVYYPNNESRVNANGRMLCRGTYSSDGGFLINGSRYICAGQSIAVQTETVSVTITVTDIQIKE